MYTVGSRQKTGTFIVTFKKGAYGKGLSWLEKTLKRTTARSREFAEHAIPAHRLRPTVVRGYDAICLAVVETDRAGLALIRAGITHGPVAHVDAQQVLAHRANSGSAGVSSGDEWGIEEVGANRSTATGAGIEIAILDSGIDINHPAFAGRIDATANFVPGESASDGVGHGTQMAGIAGGRTLNNVPRFGVAHECRFAIAKVVDAGGQTVSERIIQGINWAVARRSPIIMIAIGASTNPSEPYSQSFEEAANAALEAGCLPIAAAGNSSNRARGYFSPVDSPANCPSILAVNAIDPGKAVYNFGNRGSAALGGEVNLSAPGVGILSSAVGGGYKTGSGTSQATAFAAGVAAQHAQANGHARGWSLYKLLRSSAVGLGLDPSDVGDGLVQSP